MIANLGGRQIYTQGGTMTRVGQAFDEDAEDAYSLSWPLTLLVEVTVTHHIDEEKLRRIRALDVPTLEIVGAGLNLSSFSRSERAFSS